MVKAIGVTMVVIIIAVVHMITIVDMTMIVNYVVTREGIKVAATKKQLYNMTVIHDKQEVVEPIIEGTTSVLAMLAIFSFLMLTLCISYHRVFGV